MLRNGVRKKHELLPEVSELKTPSKTSCLLYKFLVVNAAPTTTSTELTAEIPSPKTSDPNKYPHNCFSSSSSVKSFLLTSFHEHFLFHFYLLLHLLMHWTCYEGLIQFNACLSYLFTLFMSINKAHSFSLQVYQMLSFYIKQSHNFPTTISKNISFIFD